LKIAAVVCDVYEGGDEVFSDKSYLNREVLLIGSSPANRDSAPITAARFQAHTQPCQHDDSRHCKSFFEQ
jgi:hypothetical protein